MRDESIDILTAEEHQAWHDRDSVEYFAWYSRMWNVDLDWETNGKKTPRHRFNKKLPSKP